LRNSAAQPRIDPDRALLSYLNTFPEPVVQEGTGVFDEGGVKQAYGNRFFVQGRVEHGTEMLRVSVRLQGDRWFGRCSCSSNERCEHVYALMLEKSERGDELPDAPGGEEGIGEVLEERLGRDLSDDEEQFLTKIEKRYRRFELEGEIYDHDLVRLNSKWPVDGFEPLDLWPKPPGDITDFWNYVAYAFSKKSLTFPDFMEPVTDIDGMRERMKVWEREQEITQWVDRFDGIRSAPPAPEPQQVEFRLVVTMSAGRIQLRRPDAKGDEEPDWQPVGGDADFADLIERYEEGQLRMDEASELLWTHALNYWRSYENFNLPLDSHEVCEWLGRLFQQAALKDRIVTLDDHSFTKHDEALKWVCQDPGDDIDGLPSEKVTLQLAMANGDPVPHALIVLPGAEELYLSDVAVFPGPANWVESTEIEPRYGIPREVIETASGVEFLARINAELPDSLQERVKEDRLKPRLTCQLVRGTRSADSEYLAVEVEAQSESGARLEKLGKEGWMIMEQRVPQDDRIPRFDRSSLYRFPKLLDPLGLNCDASGSFRTRVTRTFAERFAKWLEGLPEDIECHLAGDLQTLADDPLKASVRFEVEETDIDWFDLKVVIDVDGIDLSKKDIRTLVDARGGFVRLEDGSWRRLKIELNEQQNEAISKLGLDVFDLSGEKHRMHVLQLADPSAKEVFDEAAWNRICERASSIKLQVRPGVPPELQAKLRPYQVEGYHFLAYLATNRFGGILADDMGLGKTVQALSWILWLRSRRKKGEKNLPCLVVCPKSVLDVWAGESEKFAPELRVQVLRSKEELDIDRIRDSIDIFVLNYSQLRVNIDRLKELEWLAAVLDEGQQIKNPDSKAAKACRDLPAGNRLVLTGTPIENRLLDVWSLMSFAMPGVLGDRKYFRERFDRRKDPHAQVRLGARLRPFLLRRTKDQVAMDLPPRTEEDVFCKMEDIQETLYQNEMERIRKVLLGLENDEALRKNSFVVLQGLMRLRQICCHPALIDPKHAEAESAKLTALFYLLDQLHEEGHKVLVFSQFVTMLDIIKERLESNNRNFEYLTGQTKNRGEIVQQFQTSKDPTVFLLSLKAGGSGLNLTAASYVILYDPWWNPAVENQAIDRAHRIGQNSHVIAYRLLTRDSVEEKIRTLQNQKQEMITGVLGEEGFSRNLKLDDLRFLFQKEEK
jgi:hypothetical protein